MTRETEAAFLAFCTGQRDHFDPAAWQQYGDLPKQEVASAAYFLACVEWYGWKKELLRVAESLQPGITGNFAQAARKSQLDCGRFSNLLRRRLMHVYSLGPVN